MDAVSGDAEPDDLQCPKRMAQPLLKLPVEVLGMILRYLLQPFEERAARFSPHWKCSIRECSALVPVMLTCRRLHEVINSLPQVARRVIIKEARHIEPNMVRTGRKETSLIVYVSLGSGVPPNLRDWYTTEAHRIHELHLTRLGHLAMDFWTPLFSLPAPKLCTLSLTSPGGSWLPPNGVFLPLPAQASSLRYLTLKGVCFLPSTSWSSLTHFALFDVYIPRVDNNLMKFLSYCPNLESLVLSNIRDGSGTVSNIPRVDLPSLRRITLRNILEEKAKLYLTHLPRNEGQAVQLLNYSSEVDWASQYPPGTRTLCIQHHLAYENKVSTHRLEDGVLAITFVGAANTFHVTLPIRRTIYFSLDSQVSGALAPMEFLSGVREAWIVGIHATKAPQDGNDGSAAPLYNRLSDPEGHRVAMSVRSGIMGLRALEIIVLVYRQTLEPNLYILPNAQHPSFAPRNVKTVRLVLCHGLSQSPVDLTESRVLMADHPTLVLARVCEGLSSGQLAYIETLIIEVGPHVIVDDAELLQVSKHIPTVKVERIHTVPQVALPEVCRESAADQAWLGALW